MDINKYWPEWRTDTAHAREDLESSIGRLKLLDCQVSMERSQIVILKALYWLLDKAEQDSKET